MLVVFSASSQGELAQYLGIATWHNDFRNEELEYCLRRERAQEILACRALKIPYVVIAEPDFLSEDSDNPILDANCELGALSTATPLVLRLQGGAVLPEKLRAFPLLVSSGHDRQVEQWPEHIASPELFLKRHVIQMSQALFSQSYLSGDLVTPLFLKSVKKSDLHHIVETPLELRGLIKTVKDVKENFTMLTGQVKGLPDDHVVAVHQRPDYECPYRGAVRGRIKVIDLSEGVIISSVMDIERASDHKGEYRAFIINGEVSSVSAYRDYDHTPVPRQITDFAQMFAEEHRHVAPAYIADFCLTNQGPALIELNELAYSGRYIDNDAGLLYSDLERFAGVDRSVICTPRVAVPSREDTLLPETDDVVVDFGEPALALMPFGLDRPQPKLVESENSLVARFEKALVDSSPIVDNPHQSPDMYKAGLV